MLAVTSHLRPQLFNISRTIYICIYSMLETTTTYDPFVAATMHPDVLRCERHHTTVKWQTCACPKCQPALHTKINHHADLSGFRRLRGLTWRGHDAWRISRFAVSSFTGAKKPETATAVQQWNAWAKKFQLRDMRSAASPLPDEQPLLDEYALNEVIEIFSEIFFLGQLPSSKIAVRWCSLEKYQLGCLEPRHLPKDPMILWLNVDHQPLRLSAKEILCVVLHEMGHAFFDYYACWPWNRLSCASGACGKLHQLNVGPTGHGRAWQYLTFHIQQSMRQYLGFEGDLGRRVGMYNELDAGGMLFCSLSAILPEADSLTSLHPMSTGRQGPVPMAPLSMVGVDGADEGRRCGISHVPVKAVATQEQSMGVARSQTRTSQFDLMRN